MRRFSLTAAAILAFALPAAASAGTVQVDLSGLRAGGTLYVQVQTRDQFLGERRAAGRIVRAPAAGALSLDLGEVAAGDYAVTVWHDVNGNSRFDMNPAAGAAPDGWAMLNADAIRAEPTFDLVKLAVPDAGVRVPLALHYGQ